MTIDTRFIDDLRPSPEAFDPTWSAETLETIFAQPGAHPSRHHGRRRLVLITLPLATAIAVAAVVVPSLLSHGGRGPGASAAAAEILTKAAAALDAQTPRTGQYLNVKRIDRYWQNGVEQPTRGGFEDWVPGDRSLPMIEQTTEDGKITDTTPQPLDDYERGYYGDYSDDAALLDALNDAAIRQDSDEGDRDENIWGQAFRELQDAAVPVRFKAAVLRALTTVTGVKAIPTKNVVGDLRGTALIFKDNSLAFVLDPETGTYLGMSGGIDNPDAPPLDNQFTAALVLSIVDSAPNPDYELER